MLIWGTLTLLARAWRGLTFREQTFVERTLRGRI
jgi:hypothetical protein